jgi:hypothetical protein
MEVKKTKRREMPQWQQKILNEVEKYCEFIREVEAGILIRGKANLQSLPRCILHNRLTAAGAEHQDLYSLNYLIPTSHVINQHLQRLKIIFGTSQDEIEHRMSFLVREGVSVERIHNETGASRATIYRYTKRADKTMDKET